MNNDDTINNAIIKVATLEKEYDIVLKQYQEAYKNYMSMLNSSSNPCENYKLESKDVSEECYKKIWSDQGCTTNPPMSSWYKDQTYDDLVQDSFLWSTLTDEEHRKGCYNDATNYNTNTEPTYSLGKDFSELSGRTWWGKYGIKEGASKTKEECVSMCSSDINCTGATFNAVKRYCWTRGGDGIITTGLNEESALIPKIKASLLILDGLNNKLIMINEKLKTEIKKINPIIKSEEDENVLKKQKFDDTYNKLYKEKKDLKDLISEYESIDSELNNQTLVVEQSNNSLRLWTLVAFILLFVLIKQIYEIDAPTNMILFIIILIILSFSLNTPAGFAAVGLMFVCILAYSLNS
jgi:hypothetical protein